MPAAPRGRAHTPPIFLHQPLTSVFMLNLFKHKGRGWRWNSSHSGNSGVWYCLTSTSCVLMKMYAALVKLCATKFITPNLKKRRWQPTPIGTCGARTKERQFYRTVIEQAKEHPQQNTHLTFDFSDHENFALPYHARQPGPSYFKVLFRINVLGIANARHIIELPISIRLDIDDCCWQWQASWAELCCVYAWPLPDQKTSTSHISMLTVTIAVGKTKIKLFWITSAGESSWGMIKISS